MLDDRVRAVLRRLEEEAERDDPTAPTDDRSLQIPPSSGALLFALASGRPGCEVLELGGSRGYSTIWLGAAVRTHGGHVTSLEASPVKLAASAANIAAAGLDEWIDVVPGPALETLASLAGPFDLVFLDALKREYWSYFEAVLPKLADGGTILADNTLYGMDPQHPLAEFNRRVRDDPRVECVLLPFREGLTLIRRRA